MLSTIKPNEQWQIVAGLNQPGNIHEATTYSLPGRYVGTIEPSFGSIIPGFSMDSNIRAGNKIDGYFVFDANLFDKEIRYPNNTELTSLLDKDTIDPDRAIFGTLGWKF